MGYVMWIYIAIGYIFVCLADANEDGFWAQVSVMLLWPILVILFCICCIYFSGEWLYKKLRKRKYD